MKKETLYVAFSTQKGGVGKTTFTVLVASYLYYLKGHNVAVVDCDYPQHSISAMRKRDAEQVNGDDYYKQLAFSQFNTTSWWLLVLKSSNTCSIFPSASIRKLMR